MEQVNPRARLDGKAARLRSDPGSFLRDARLESHRMRIEQQRRNRMSLMRSQVSGSEGQERAPLRQQGVRETASWKCWNEGAFVRWFLKAGGGILALTGLAKAFSAIGPARVLELSDPLIGLPFRQILLFVGLVELLVAFSCLFTDKRELSVFAIAWLSTNFLVYRLGLWSIGWHRPCSCLGTLTDLLHFSPGAADKMMQGVLAYLLVGSYGMLFWRWRFQYTHRGDRGWAIMTHLTCTLC